VLIGYMRVSKADGSQTLDLQRDALLAAGGGNFSGGFELRFVGQLDQHVPVTCLRCAPAYEILTTKLRQGCHQVRPMQQPSAIHRDHEVAVDIAREFERVRPFALAPAVPSLPANIDLVRLRLVRLPSSCVHDNRHGLVSDQSGEGYIISAPAGHQFFWPAMVGFFYAKPRPATSGAFFMRSHLAHAREGRLLLTISSIGRIGRDQDDPVPHAVPARAASQDGAVVGHMRRRHMVNLDLLH
jgi:hypothetical protein